MSCIRISARGRPQRLGDLVGDGKSAKFKKVQSVGSRVKRSKLMSIEEMKRNERSFVLINVEAGKEERVMNELLRFNEVKEVHEITGEKDILVVLETKRDMVAPGSERIANFVTHKIARIHGVTETDTIIPTASKIKT